MRFSNPRLGIDEASMRTPPPIGVARLSRRPQAFTVGRGFGAENSPARCRVRVVAVLSFRAH